MSFYLYFYFLYYTHWCMYIVLALNNNVYQQILYSLSSQRNFTTSKRLKAFKKEIIILSTSSLHLRFYFQLFFLFCYYFVLYIYIFSERMRLNKDRWVQLLYKICLNKKEKFPLDARQFIRWQSRIEEEHSENEGKMWIMNVVENSETWKREKRACALSYSYLLSIGYVL